MAFQGTYDPSQVVVTVGGIPISGFADGTFINISRMNDAFTKVTGAQGETARAKSSDRSGEMTLTLLQTSDSNTSLSALALVDEQTNAGVVPVIVKDLSGNSTYFTGNGWIRKIADSEFSKEITNREWVFDLADMDVLVGGTV